MVVTKPKNTVFLKNTVPENLVSEVVLLCSLYLLQLPLKEMRHYFIATSLQAAQIMMKIND